MLSAGLPLRSGPLVHSSPSSARSFFSTSLESVLRLVTVTALADSCTIIESVQVELHEGKACPSSSSRRRACKITAYGATKQVGCDIDSEWEDSS